MLEICARGASTRTTNVDALNDAVFTIRQWLFHLPHVGTMNLYPAYFLVCSLASIPMYARAVSLLYGLCHMQQLTLLNLKLSVGNCGSGTSGDSVGLRVCSVVCM